MSQEHLTREERIAIDLFLRLGLSCREIALCIDRSHTTISRELLRNASAKGYRHQTAQQRAELRRKQPRHYRCQEREKLVAYVDSKLRSDWAPEQIAGRIRLDFPHDSMMRISTETIYRWVYTAASHDGTSHRHLRRVRSRRRPQARYGQGKRIMSGRVDISERPEVVARRSRIGDWEGDLVSGSFGRAALVSCVERKSRYLLLAKVEDKTAASFNAALAGQLQAVPSALRKTLTLDNGSEMARFKELEAATGLSTYFCTPRSPWQRGTNENSNGLLRQYFPRGTSFRKTSKDMISKVVERLNIRPRKCLGYRTPAEVFAAALKTQCLQANIQSALSQFHTLRLPLYLAIMARAT
jgi:IS30 family transposase